MLAPKRRKFDCYFKVNAVKLSYNRETIKDAAAELGILPCILTRWRKEYIEFGSGSFCGSGYDKVHPEKLKIFELEKKLKESARRFEILKSGHKYLFKDSITAYKFIFKNEKKYPITLMCRVLEIGNGRYLRWKKNGISKKKQEVALLKKEISSIFLNFNKLYGRNKIAKELHNRGWKVSERQVSFYMRELGLRRIAKRKYKVTTDSSHNHYTAKNVLNRKFKTDGPSKAWVSDITYLQTRNRFLYLTIIMDLYDRKIVGWNLGARLTTQSTTVPALKMAAERRLITKGLIFHSDRGVQYANKKFTVLLDSYNCIRSMSRKGDHLDNAVSESFFSSLKRELFDKKGKLLTIKEMKTEIFEFIENWYNTKRLHSALDYKSIEEFNFSYQTIA